MLIKIGTRGSKLALVQTREVENLLKTKYPQLEFEEIIISTKGDKDKRPLSIIGGNGLFIEEIENELLAGKIDMAVHSMKDLPLKLKEGLVLSKTIKRNDHRDVLVLNEKIDITKESKPIVATGSIRRKQQLLKLYPNAEVVDIRGNVDTRLKKMYENNYTGLVLAKAGLNRLGLTNLKIQDLDFVPSPCQGAIGIEIKANNQKLLEMLESISDEKTSKEVMCERSFMEDLGADCKKAIGAYCHIEEDIYHMDCLYDDYRFSLCAKDEKELIKEACKKVRHSCFGQVALVGAGPGDKEYITLKAIKELENADCVIYDRLIPNDLLSYCKKDCECIYVGKANHIHTLTQDKINELLVKKAMEYKNVVRLKGGDIFVLARGQEEVEYLKQRGVRYKLISGLSSCIVAPASVGIPLTARGIANGFQVLSAHNYKGEYLDIDFKALAKTKETIVILMGLNKVQKIAKSLLENGAKEDLPIAIISNATTNSQKALFSTLGDIQNTDINLPSPGLIVIGEVVNCHDEVKEETINSKELYLPKIGNEPSRLSAELINCRVYELCVSKIELIKIVNEDIADVVIFSSKHGVDGFFNSLNKDIRAYVNTRFVTIGSATKKHLETYGIKSSFTPSAYNSDTLIEELVLQENELVEYYGSNAPSIVENLKDRCRFKNYIVYQNNPVALLPINIAQDAKVVFTSASNVENFKNNLINFDDWKEKGKAYSIGEKTSEALRKLGVNNILQSKVATYHSLAELINED